MTDPLTLARLLYVLLLGIPCAGATLILVRSDLFTPLRMKFARWPTWHAFVRCPMCAGAWVGIIALLLLDVLAAWPAAPDVFPTAIGALASGGIVGLYSRLADSVGSKPLDPAPRGGIETKPKEDSK
jgi:hypothetical protein